MDKGLSLAEMVLAGMGETDAFRAARDASDETAIAPMLALADHPDVEVRRVLACNIALLTHGDPPSVEMVAVTIRMTLDADTSVRDWASSWLAEWREIDTPELRDALATRLDDIDRDTRSEALVGLAYRRDPRAVPRVRAALSRPGGELWRLEMVAAGALADPDLHELVLRHQDGWDDEENVELADAARRLTDPDGPGEDLFDGVALLCRRRALGLPDGDALDAWHLLLRLNDLADHKTRDYVDAVRDRLAGNEAALRELATLEQIINEIPEDE